MGAEAFILANPGNPRFPKSLTHSALDLDIGFILTLFLFGAEFGFQKKLFLIFVCTKGEGGGTWCLKDIFCNKKSKETALEDLCWMFC